MQKLIGSRLKKAREEMGLSQGAFAKALNLSSEYISLLEAGKRTPSFDTLNAISSYINKEISYFFEQREPVFTVLFQAESIDDRARVEFQKFRRYCEKYLELEEATNRRLQLAPLYTNASAESLADEERRRLGLGDGPIRDIFALCEFNGCRIFRHPLPEESRVSGLFVYIEEKGAAFALINASDPPDQQVLTVAHEYAHFLKDRLESPVIDNRDVFIDEYVSLYSPREQFAQAFASRFLMPPSKIREIVEKDIRPNRIGYDDVLFLKRYFGVSTQAMLRQLRNLNYLRRERFEDYFKRDPGPRELEIFGSATEGRSRRGSRKSIPSDRFKLLARESAQIQASRQRGERENLPDPIAEPETLLANEEEKESEK